MDGFLTPVREGESTAVRRTGHHGDDDQDQDDDDDDDDDDDERYEGYHARVG